MFRIHWSSVLAGLGLACVVSGSPLTARAVTVSVSPADTTVKVGATFTLRVMTDAFPDLKAYQLMFRYAPAVLSYAGATAGDILTGTGRAYTMQQVPDVASPSDTAWVDCAQLVGSTSGPGVAVYFTFEALAVGDSPIECLLVDFRDSWNDQTLPACLGGIVRVVEPPVAVPPRSWGSIKTMYR